MHKSNQNTYQSHQKAAEYHNLAAHAHLVAATQYEQGHDLKGIEHSREALNHTRKAYQHSLVAHGKARTEPVSTQGEAERDISVLAYQLWQDRGCPEGSSEQDWFHAMEELQFRN